MEPDKLWLLLVDLARRIGVEVRLENLQGDEEYSVSGGLCRLGGRLVAFVDRGFSPLERSRQLGRALSGLDLESVYLKPAVRDFMDNLTQPDME